MLVIAKVPIKGMPLNILKRQWNGLLKGRLNLHSKHQFILAKPITSLANTSPERQRNSRELLSALLVPILLAILSTNQLIKKEIVSV